MIHDGTNWTCQCEDFKENLVNCKHIFAVDFSMKLRLRAAADLPENAGTAVTPPSNEVCPYCDGDDTVHNGTPGTAKSHVQRLLCRACKRTFILDSAFSRIKVEPSLVTITMDLYLSGLSLRKVARHLGRFYKVNVSHTTVLDWVRGYSGLLAEFAKTLKPEVGDVWHSDEMTANVDGE